MGRLSQSTRFASEAERLKLKRLCNESSFGSWCEDIFIVSLRSEPCQIQGGKGSRCVRHTLRPSANNGRCVAESTQRALVGWSGAQRTSHPV